MMTSLQILALLQSLHESHAITEVRTQAVLVRESENGRNAATQHVLDRSE